MAKLNSLLLNCLQNNRANVPFWIRKHFDLNLYENALVVFVVQAVDSMQLLFCYEIVVGMFRYVKVNIASVVFDTELLLLLFNMHTGFPRYSWGLHSLKILIREYQNPYFKPKEAKIDLKIQFPLVIHGF